ncbi:MAG: 30S ribosomal protein S2 [Candidatus Mycalebacterium zealandia]|nr:MAG: 30S ribosomal protein S2 [Candidatus Mycalebacterium zealandia]
MGGNGELNMKQLLEAGAHFGHQKSYWNPKMKNHIFDVRNGVHIINLQKTVDLFRVAYQFVFELTSKGGIVLFVGTKQQARGIIKEESQRCSMPFVNVRWLGGALTNFSTIRSRLQYMEMLRKLEEENKMDLLPNKEAVKLRKEEAKLSSIIGGIASMKRLPDAVFIVDTNKEQNAFKEAKKLGIPIVGLVDTNCDPTGIDYVIPTNDDAMRAIKLFASKIADACVEGAQIYAETVKDIPEEQLREQKKEMEGPIVEKKVYVFKKFGEDEENPAEISVVNENRPPKQENKVEDTRKTPKEQPGSKPDGKK